MPGESERPTLRGFVKTVWPIISNQAGRDLKKMRHVRPELMRVVYSHLTDEEGVHRMRGIVRSDPQAARVTLAYIARTRDHTYEYETDRAYRILVAAMRNSRPEGVKREEKMRSFSSGSERLDGAVVARYVGVVGGRGSRERLGRPVWP